MNEVQFYNDLSDRLGLPRAATKEGWLSVGRVLAPVACHRFYEFGVAFYGIESTAPAAAVPVEEAKEDNKVSVAEIFKRGLRGATVILNGEVGTAADAAMIARDGPAKPAVAAIPSAPQPPAKPAMSGLTLSPDLRATSHLVEPVHGSVALVRELRNR